MRLFLILLFFVGNSAINVTISPSNDLSDTIGHLPFDAVLYLEPGIYTKGVFGITVATSLDLRCLQPEEGCTLQGPQAIGRFFTVNAEVTLALTSVTLKNGNVTIGSVSAIIQISSLKNFWARLMRKITLEVLCW